VREEGMGQDLERGRFADIEIELRDSDILR
jgi:hypothetical protein